MSTANVETLQLPSYLGGEAIDSVDTLTVHYPYDGSIVGAVSKVNGDHLDLVIDRTLSFDGPSSRFDRSQVLTRARELLLERAGEFANLIRLESGLCMRETNYEVGRACDVFQFAAAEALKDDGEIFSGPR